MILVVPWLVFIQICSNGNVDHGDPCQNMESAKVPKQHCLFKHRDSDTEKSTSFEEYDETKEKLYNCESEYYWDYSKRSNDIQATKIKNPLCTGIIYTMKMVLTSASCVNQALAETSRIFSTLPDSNLMPPALRMA